MHLFKNTNFDFLKWRWHAIGLSTLVIVAGLFAIMTKGIPLGIEFAGGTSVIVQFDEQVNDDQVRSALAANYPGGAEDTVVQTYDDPAKRQKLIRVPQVGGEQGAELTATADQVMAAIQ